MMNLRRYIPPGLARPLFGDRAMYGTRPCENDPCWKEWQKTYWDFYHAVNAKGLAKCTNHAGYRAVGRIELSRKRVLEIGPAHMHHVRYWRGQPSSYVIADIMESSLALAKETLASRGVPFESVLLPVDARHLPFADGSFDVVVAISTLEHVWPLEEYLSQIRRVLARGGVVVGSIPCEGGLAWGLGRYVTSRRWIHAHTSINYDKIISWEHPNFSDDILRSLDGSMKRRFRRFWPLAVPSIDINLVVQFVYEKV